MSPAPWAGSRSGARWASPRPRRYCDYDFHCSYRWPGGRGQGRWSQIGAPPWRARDWWPGAKGGDGLGRKGNFNSKVRRSNGGRFVGKLAFDVYMKEASRNKVYQQVRVWFQTVKRGRLFFGVAIRYSKVVLRWRANEVMIQLQPKIGVRLLPTFKKMIFLSSWVPGEHDFLREVWNEYETC